MPFDVPTRNRLATLVGDVRTLLTAEFLEQCQRVFGISPTGNVTELDRLGHLDDAERVTATLLRERVTYLVRTHPDQKEATTGAVTQLVREQAFTVLNRLAALRMAEKRGLAAESVGKGYQSKGFKVFETVARTGLGDAYHRYRQYLLCLFDELALDLGVLFDRRSPQGMLFPREPALLQCLNLLNAADVDALWAEDETIGWVYQYYNDPAERKRMREAPAPRNSRELAVRNQFFTPRYIVEFLTDNTLGRIWYEMTQGQTRLRDECGFLVRRPTEVFLEPGVPFPEALPLDNLSQKQLLQQPVYVPHRPLKDPREIRMLDPACGSMHFGLYAFDLFEVIYDEAWENANGGDKSRLSPALFDPFVSFAAAYADKAAFSADVPRLIIEHNLHGVDIDPRSAQIAGLSLWLRAQRTWQKQGLRPQARPRISRSNVVCAEPMPGDAAALDEFIEVQLAAAPERKLLGQLVRRVFDAMKLAGEAGSLLKIEEEVVGAVGEAKQRWLAAPKLEQGRLFSQDNVGPVQQPLALDISGITDEAFWVNAEERIYDALQDYAERTEHGGGYGRRLFADDAARGFAFVDLCRKRYDVVLMNPPFGDATPNTLDLVRRAYPEYAENLFVAFHSRASQLLVEAGLVGAISSRTFVTYRDFERFRAKLLGASPLSVFADLGWEVLDGAQVETAAYVTSKGTPPSDVFGPFFRLLAVALDQKGDELLRSCQLKSLERTYFARRRSLECLPGSPLCYWSSDNFVGAVAKAPALYPTRAYVGLGASPHAFFFRAWWEVCNKGIGDRWKRICRGGDFSPFYRSNALVIDWHRDGGSVKEYILRKYPYLNGNFGWKIQDEDKYGLPGLTWGKRNERFNVQAMPAGHIFTDEGQGIVPVEQRESAFLLGYLNSALVAYFLSLTSGLQKHYVYIRPVPVLPLSPDSVRKIEAATTDILKIKQEWDSTSELSPLFRSPTPAPLGHRASLKDAFTTANAAWLSDAETIKLSRERIDTAIFADTSLGSDDVSEIRSLVAGFPKDAPNIEGFTPSDDGVFTQSLAATVGYLVGAAFGRWDIRLVTGEKTAPALPDPFATLPLCPPGQLQNEHGVPLEKEDVGRLKEEGRWSYPIEIAWDGILADDPGHTLDLETHVHRMLQLIWREHWEAIEREAREILDVPTLRHYFRRPAGFFADHLERYSKSRRQAPIYWPLSSAKGGYTLWVYYHRLTDQTLHTAVADFIDPKIRDTERAAADARACDRRQEADDLADLVSELRDFRAEVERVIGLPWKPNLNDGVLISASPLWKLFRFKKWQKDLKACWDSLEEGDYDWAHLALAIWPDRVKRACETDRSIAIAHGLEELCKVPTPSKPASKRRRRKTVLAEATE
ncbi:MAG: BREX-1 system adenine-specific DNA-methyltransferase PglX [Vicinamibacterales bacterium]